MIPTRLRVFSIAATAAFAVIAADVRTAHADVIRSPTSVVLNTMGEYSASFPATEAIDQSDLSAGFVSGTTDFDAYLAGNPTQTGNPGGAWYAASGTVAGTIGFDLGGTFAITRLALWNLGNYDDVANGLPYGANVKGFEVYTSSVSDFSSETLVGSFTATSGTVAYDTVGAQVFDLTDSVARYVRLRILTNYGATNTTGIGELAFATTAPPTTGVPEPSILFLLATGALAVASRRRG